MRNKTKPAKSKVSMTRRFNGRLFRLAGEYDSEHAAARRATEYEDYGFYVRVIESGKVVRVYMRSRTNDNPERAW